MIDRKKTGFDIPTHDWFRGPLRVAFDDTLTTKAVAESRVFHVAGDRIADSGSPGAADQRGISLMGIDDAVPVDEAMESGGGSARDGARRKVLRYYSLIVASDRGGWSSWDA